MPTREHRVGGVGRDLEGPRCGRWPGRLGWLGLGAGLMYVLDPGQGGPRRARVRDRLVRALHRLDDAIGVVSRELGQRIRRIRAEECSLPEQLAGEELADDVLVARVRAELGRHASEAGSIGVTAHRGRVILRGPIHAGEAEGLLSAVAAVPGAVAVEEHLALHARADGRPGPPETGAVWRPGERPELWQVNWPAPARAVAGVAGAALVVGGARRGGLAGLALGALGAGLLGRGIANIPLHHLLGMSSGPRPAEERPGPAARDLPRAGYRQVVTR